MNLSHRIGHVFVRNLVSYKRFILPTFIVSLGQPLFYLVTFGVGMGAYMGHLGGRPYLQFLVPGVIASSVMMSATFTCLYDTLVKILHERIYESLIATPASAEDVIAGDVAWGAFRGLLSGFFMLLIAALMGVHPASVLHVLLLLLLMAFIGALFSALAMIVTSFAYNFDFFSYYTELVITPMLFFSGVFFPLDNFPAWLKAFAGFLPLTHAVNLTRAAFYGEAFPGLFASVLTLLLFGAAAFVLGVRLMKRRLIK